MKDEMLYENLDYGSYMITYEGTFNNINENVVYAGAEFNKLYTRRVRLPDGKSNIIYLLSDNFNDTIRMLSNDNFIIPPSYKRLFYPPISIGKFMGRRYSMNVKSLAGERTRLIKEKTKLTTFNSIRVLPKTTNNVFFCTSDLYESFKKIMSSLTIKRLYMEFFKEFIGIIRNMSPEPINDKNKNSAHRILLIDCDSFAFKSGAPVNDNKTNPLFLLYLAFLRTKDLSKLNVDMDMLICSKNLFMKFNPSKITDMNQWNKFKRALFRIMNANLDDYTTLLSEEDKKEISDTGTDKVLSNIVSNRTEVSTKYISPSTKAVLDNAIENKIRNKVSDILTIDKELKTAGVQATNKLPDTFKSVINTNPMINPLDQKREKLFKSIGGLSYNPLGKANGLYIDELDEDDEEIDIFSNEVENDVDEIMSTDEEIASEVLDEIQDKSAPLKNLDTAPVNSALDQKLREEQKKVVVQNETIEEILSRDQDIVPIETTDKSKVMHTSNENMKNIKYANVDKTYIDKMLNKHIVACFDALKDKDSPFYITNIDIVDSSDSLNYKETWTVTLVDENKKKHKMKVDIPKFQNYRFMWIRGTRWIILKQNFYNPLVKDTPDTVILTTNFNKVTITRKATRSMSSIERLFSLVKKTGDTNMFVSGDASINNMRYISCLEYDEISKKLFKFKSGNCEIYFSRGFIEENNLMDTTIKLKNDEFYIGTENGSPIIINEITGLDRHNRTIVEIITDNLSDEYKNMLDTIKAPSQSMYSECTLAGQDLPVIVVLLIWEGLKKTLDRMNISWEFIPGGKKVNSQPGKKYIRFADGILEYSAKIYAELILNGINKLHPNKLKFSDFETEEAYDAFIYSKWGNYNGLVEIKNFYEFLIDPITEGSCKRLSLPYDPSGLMIHAIKLLSDNGHVSKASDKSYRARSIEIIPGILYSCIAQQYKAYVKAGRRIPMTLNQNCVIQRLIMEKTVEAYSTLNPVIEISKAYTISAKGYRGSNSEHSYDEEKRSYDPSSVGKLAMSTSPDRNVGLNRSLAVEPTISDVMGYRDQVEDVETLKDVNIFSPVEMLTPGTARMDDPIRTSISNIPVVDGKLYIMRERVSNAN